MLLQPDRAIWTKNCDAGIFCNAICPSFFETAHGLKEIVELDAARQEWEGLGLVAVMVFLVFIDANFKNGKATYVDNV